MIWVLGDTHNFWQRQLSALSRLGWAEGDPILHVGDLEWHPDRPIPALPGPVHFVDGNHDHLPSLLCLNEPTEVAANLIYCPRGSVLELGGKRIGFLGGARSIDREVRVEGKSWWEEEECTFQEAKRLQGEKVDLLLTHTPPSSVVETMGFDRPDRSSVVLQTLWTELGRPPLYCGHMHQGFEKGPVVVLAAGDVRAVR